MAVKVVSDFSQWAKLSFKIRAMQRRAKNLEPVLKGRAEALETVIQSSFRQSKDPVTGRGWAALAPETIERRRKKSGKPLIDTGALRGATHARATRRGVIFGVSGAPATYAGTHQFGRPGKVHARPFLPMDDRGEADFSGGKAAKWLKRAKKRVRKYVFTGEI